MRMKIYTKTGDRGTTSIIGGKQVLKCDARVEAYGTVDELNADLGLLRDLSEDEQQVVLLRIQRRLFDIQSLLAAEEPEKHSFLKPIQDNEVLFLETEIDRMSHEIPPFKAFILAGGHPLVSQIHVARCICRRAERRVVALAQTAAVQENVLRYINRLSDYLFVLARYTAFRMDIPETFCQE